MHDCLEAKGVTRYVDPRVVTLTEMFLAQARFIDPESRTDQSDPGSDGERNVHHHTDSCYAFTTVHVHSVYTERAPLLRGKDTKTKIENLVPPGGFLTSPTNTSDHVF